MASPPTSHIGLQFLQFDAQGMLLPHSILGTLEDFREHLEANGLTDLVKRIQRPVGDAPLDVGGQLSFKAAEKESPSRLGNKETNALQQWDREMRHRRQQQNILSDRLNRPVENLLMNQGKHFREFQEKRELLNQTLPSIQPGYGHHVGCEFWSLPQLFGDELSGITSTLTQTERGRREPVTHVGQPSSIRLETGLSHSKPTPPVPKAQHHSSYLQKQFERIEGVFEGKDTKMPDLCYLELIGSSQPEPLAAVCHHSSVGREEDESESKEKTQNNLDRSVKFNDVPLNTLQVPALRFCGQLASWTGNSATNQGVIGISGLIIFETLAGEITSAKMELHNEGSTVIFFSWQKLPVKQMFPCNQRYQSMRGCFYFNSSGGAINPGEVRSFEFIFKSEEPGIKTEAWQLNTHPVVMQGASLQVTLKGIALLNDATADQRQHLKNKLEKIVGMKTCRLILEEVLQGVHSPARPGSPVELPITEEQQFLKGNPKFQFVHQPVQSLKRLWEQVSPGESWDLSVDTLRQAVLRLPDETSGQPFLSREEGLSQVNHLILQLYEPSTVKHRLTARTVGQQMVRSLLDTIADKAMHLGALLQLPEGETWTEKCNKSTISDSADVAEDINKEDGAKAIRADETRNGERSRLKDKNKVESRSPVVQKTIEVSKRGGKREDDEGRIAKEKLRKESGSLVKVSLGDKPPDVQEADPEVKRLYSRLLHQKIYALMEEFVDSLCDLLEDVDPEQQHGDELHV